MNLKEHEAHFYKEKDRICALHISNQIERDKTILNLSTFSLTILTGFGRDILLVNKILGVVIIILLTVTILMQIVGFYITDKNVVAVLENMDRNVMENRRFFEPSHVRTEWSKMIEFFAGFSMVTITTGFALLAIVMIQFLLR